MTDIQDLKDKVLDSFGLDVSDIPQGIVTKWQALTGAQKAALLQELAPPDPQKVAKVTALKIKLLSAADNIGIDLGQGDP
jgi:hypothetical protein